MYGGSGRVLLCLCRVGRPSLTCSSPSLMQSSILVSDTVRIRELVPGKYGGL